MTSRPRPDHADHDDTDAGTGMEVLVAIAAVLLPEEERVVSCDDRLELTRLLALLHGAG